MAYVTDLICSACQAVTTHVNGECSICRERQDAEELEKWKAMSVDDRLLDLHKRLLRVESAPIRYGGGLP